MNRLTLAVVLMFSIIFGVGPAASQDGEKKTSRAAEDFVENGIAATIAASCKKIFPPTKCRNGYLILHSHGQEPLQAAEFDGLSIGHKSGDIVMATITKARWPVYRGLRVGTSRAAVLRVLGTPTERRSDGKDESAEILYWGPGESSAKFVFDERGLVTEVTWELYYD